MTTCTRAAAATGLPAIIEPTPRRGFLRQLASLPLIGGGMKLFGAPTAVAEPVTPELLEAYKTWLDNERRYLSWEMAADPAVLALWQFPQPQSHEERGQYAQAIDRTYKYGTPAWNWHPAERKPYDRAALVLAAVGCDWREGQSRDRRRA